MFEAAGKDLSMRCREAGLNDLETSILIALTVPVTVKRKPSIRSVAAEHGISKSWAHKIYVEAKKKLEGVR